jgi:hypothetical protein
VTFLVRSNPSYSRFLDGQRQGITRHQTSSRRLASIHSTGSHCSGNPF